MENENKIVGGYCRVSSAGQVHDNTQQGQRDALTAWATSRGVTLKFYEDLGLSGKRGVERPAFDRMMADAKAGKLAGIVATKIDRTSRSLLDLLQMIDTLSECGVTLSYTGSSIDTTTPEGRVVAAIIGSIAEFERELIVERTSAGRERAMKQGVHFGAPFGDVDNAVMDKAIYDIEQKHYSVAFVAREITWKRGKEKRIGMQATTLKKMIARYKAEQAAREARKTA